jgi:hypothetical protein
VTPVPIVAAAVTPRSGSGLAAIVSFAGLDADRLKISVELTAGSIGTGATIHVHEGTCEDLGPSILDVGVLEGHALDTERSGTLADIAGASVVFRDLASAVITGCGELPAG